MGVYLIHIYYFGRITDDDDTYHHQLTRVFKIARVFFLFLSTWSILEVYRWAVHFWKLRMPQNCTSRLWRDTSRGLQSTVAGWKKLFKAIYISWSKFVVRICFNGVYWWEIFLSLTTWWYFPCICWASRHARLSRCKFAGQDSSKFGRPDIKAVPPPCSCHGDAREFQTPQEEHASSHQPSAYDLSAKIHRGSWTEQEQSAEASNQWEFQDPKMELLYHIFGHILWGYSLT